MQVYFRLAPPDLGVASPRIKSTNPVSQAVVCSAISFTTSSPRAAMRHTSLPTSNAIVDLLANLHCPTSPSLVLHLVVLLPLMIRWPGDLRRDGDAREPGDLHRCGDAWMPGDFWRNGDPPRACPVSPSARSSTTSRRRRRSSWPRSRAPSARCPKAPSPSSCSPRRTMSPVIIELHLYNQVLVRLI